MMEYQSVLSYDGEYDTPTTLITPRMSCSACCLINFMARTLLCVMTGSLIVLIVMLIP
jgi:hypothetical protein